MSNYWKILLLVLVIGITIFVVRYVSRIKSNKNELSNVSFGKVTLPYRFKSKEAEQLSVSAFNLEKDGNYENAISQYHKAIQIENDNPKLYFELSECYARNNELQQAVMALNSAIILDSSYPGFYSNRGVCYYHLFEDEKAVADFEKAVQLNSKNPVYYYNLSMAYYSTNRLNEACNAFTQAKTLGLDIDKTKNQNEFIKLQELCK
jgi:Flp pilus assembly protein TadD